MLIYFNIYQYVYFARNTTKSGTSSKSIHTKPISSAYQHFYFNGIVRLWNHMPTIYLPLPTNLIKRQLTTFLWNKFSYQQIQLRPLMLLSRDMSLLSLLKSTDSCQLQWSNQPLTHDYSTIINCNFISRYM